RHPRAAALAAAALCLMLAATGCSAGGTASRADAPAASASGVRGPLCELLPAGSDPGNPASLVGEAPEEALRWIPVLTTFEAAVRASGLAAELRAGSGMTVLAPTDDAFAVTFSEENLDQLLLTRKDTLRELLREHLVAGSLSLSDLLAAGEVTTLAGTRLTVTGAATGARLADRADTVCADYRAGTTRIHLINRVLGNLPVTAGTGGDRSH
ncbi:fasciclin domain-containing protein, partial [Micromonospora sp. NPDC003776]